MIDAPLIKTSIPGPKSKAVLENRYKYVPRGVFETFPIVVDHASGAVVTDLDGNRFIDFTTGIAATNIGHVSRNVYEAIVRQAGKLIHSCIHVASYEPYIRLAEELCRIAPVDKPCKSFFLNSGAEAVENAVKIARYYRKCIGVITFDYSFHGRTLLTMSLTSKVRPYKYGFYAYTPGVVRMPYPYPYRCPFGSNSPEECGNMALEFIERGFRTYIDPDEVAAIIFEPIAGEGGYIVPPDNFVKGLREICDRHGIILIIDEVQTGMGRTGKLFCIEHFGVKADMITLAKSLGSGLPISSVVGRGDVMDSVHVGGIGGTYGGNPIAAASALATIETVKGLLSHASRIGEYMDKRLSELYEKYSVIGEYRGIGAMKAIELVKSRASREPYKDLTERIVHEAMRRGLLILKAGVYDNVIRLIPPINIEFSLLEKGFNILDESIRASLG